MNTGYLLRQYFPTHTLGIFIARDQDGKILMTCNFLELPWKDNERNISCIPEGAYRCTQRETKKFGKHYQVHDVPGRSGILQHPGNYTSDIEGCQLPGQKFTALNDDKIPDIAYSRITLDKMLATLGKEYTLHVISTEAPAFESSVSPKFWIK